MLLWQYFKPAVTNAYFIREAHVIKAYEYVSDNYQKEGHAFSEYH
jgi:hypothetical protein